MQLAIFLFPFLGYLFGSLPFALWITRLVKGTDIRDAGSGHVTTTNTIRQAGWLPGILVAILDISKGFVPTYLALNAGMPNWVLALTAAAIVMGHCWPIFAGFRGGMGLATTAGILLAVSPLGFLVAFAILLLCVLLIRHAARGAVVAALLAPFVFWVLGLRGPELWVGAAAALVLAARFYLEDWNRRYRELWLDRDHEDQSK
ncbi:MAG TPA: acyl-phosphate glycerol 3-phosphate acyltransferase [Chloroflexi bacterium]|nr:acyl-phosphate glycerol 3-phosphate acyltransferase [Chloroflexota bacterium]